jgi:heparin/heparan-sulfate lyase
MVVLMNMREYSAKNHVHLDVGNFDIYYKGHLALDAGIYQGKDPDNGWGKLNYVNYYARTVAHNSLLILDPNEPTPYEGSNVKAISRDGGQFSFKNRAWDSIQEMLAGGKSAQILAHEISTGIAPDYTYLMGDMTRTYNVPANVTSYPPKADTVRRSFVFLNLKNSKVPGALIVLDKVVSTKVGFKKTWLLHSQNEPVIRKNEIEIANTNNGRNGKLVNSILIPEANNRVIEKVGGDGKEYWVDGKNWGTVTQEDAGRWRIELSPRKPALSDNFLNVIQVMDAHPSQKPFPVEKSWATKGNYVAVSINNRIVAQQLSLNRTKNEIEVTIGDAKKDYDVLVTDLKSGNWFVESASGNFTTAVPEDSGTAYFKSKGGTFILKFEK